MKRLLLLLILMPFASVKGQVSVYQGNWQYFDTDSTYHELTIYSDNFYRFNLDGDTEMLDVKIDDKDLIFSKKEKWTLYAKNTKFIDVITAEGKMRLYRITRTTDTVKAYYESLNGAKRRAKTVFSDEAEKRRKNLYQLKASK